MFDLVLYQTPAGNYPVKDYIAKLAKKHKAQELASIDLYRKRLQEHGLQVNDVYHNTIKPIREGIYELRPDTTRIFFFFFFFNKIILLHAIEKKRKDIPPDEIAKAIQEKNEFLRRNKNGKGTKF